MCLLPSGLPQPGAMELHNDEHAVQEKNLSALYETDEFRLYCFKVLPCSRRAQHNWQECVFAHWGEKARRRDIRTHFYSSQLCPDVKRVPGGCPRGDACHMSHNIFESWLHPELYRTQLCTSGSKCHRTVCFFAHSVNELRTPTKLPSAGSNSAAAAQPAAPTPATGTCPAASGSGSPLLTLQQQELNQMLLTAQDSTAAAHAAYSPQPQVVLATSQVAPNPCGALSGASLLDASPRTFQQLVGSSGQGGLLLPQAQPAQSQSQHSPCSSTMSAGSSNAGLLLLQGPGIMSNSSPLLQQQQQRQLPLVMSSSCMLAASPATSLDCTTISWLQQQQSPGLANPAAACFMPGVSQNTAADVLFPTSGLTATGTEGFMMASQQQDAQQQQLQQHLLLLHHQELQLQQALLLQQQLQGMQLAQQPVPVSVGVPASYALVSQHYHML